MATVTTIWVKDENHRVYERDERGRAIGAPIYRAYWQQKQVASETTRSWVLRNGTKVPKNDALRNKRYFALTEQEVDADVYVHDHSYKIAEAVRKLDAATLQQVAKVIGYKPTE